MARRKKPKIIKVRLIERTGEDGKVRQPYQIMEELVGKYHPHLATAKIALAWRFDMKANADGLVTLGQARKASDLDRELHQFDFVIILNSDMWNRAGFEERHMRALIDHELCHCEVQKDKDGEEKTDASGRYIWRIRKHDVEEFREIVARHGLWKADLEAFAKTCVEKAEDAPTLFPDAAPSPQAVKIAEKLEETAPVEVLGSGPVADSLRKVLAENSPKKTAKLVDQAIRTCIEAQDVSVSLLQRRMNIGYSRATEVVKAMVEAKLLKAPESDKGKYHCTVTAAQWEQMKRTQQAA
jgi:hypothetical protein